MNNIDILVGIIELKEDLFTNTWKEFCTKNEIPFTVIREITSKSLGKLKKVSGVLWHWNINDFENYFLAKQFLTSLDQYSNVTTFPDFKTVWHYDDKLLQSIILSLIEAPQPKFWFFTNKDEAKKWSDNANYPIVFKLRKGAGSHNVRLIENKKTAQRLINKMFRNGIRATSSGVKDTFKKKDFRKIFNYGLKNAARFILQSKKISNDIGYVYFQEFIPDCDRDFRVIIISEKAYIYNRFIRKNDFRASGSGKYLIDHKNIDIECIKIAFEVSNKLNSKSCAFDFIKSELGYLIVEISYDFVPAAGTYNGKWHGYWDKNLNYVSEEVNPLILMIEGLIEDIHQKKL